MSSRLEGSGALRLAEPRFGAEALAALEEVLSSGRLSEGPRIQMFERAIAELCGVTHAIATSSCSTGLELVLSGLDVGTGDEVVVADFTYPATGNAVLQRGATARLIDVDPHTYCAHPEAVADALTDRTAAVIVVDVFGLPADYAVLEPLLAERGIPLVCDAACSLGGAIGSRRCGSFGTASCFSFHPRKSLTTGEGGMVTTDNEALAERLRRLRNHGSERHGWQASFLEPGFNFRLSELGAALGLVQVPEFPQAVERRRMLAATLTEGLTELQGVRPQQEPHGTRHPYQSYVVIIDEAFDRDAVIRGLRDRNVESTLGTYALHAEPAFLARCGTEPGDLPVSLRLMRQTLALPLHQRLHEADLARVVDALGDALLTARRPVSERAPEI